jgi:hypothetical protein
VSASGNCSVSASRGASTNYNAISTAQTMTIAVSKASQTLSFTSTVPSTPIAGDTYSVSTSATSGLAPTHSIASGDCIISSNIVTFSGSGNCVIRASQSGDSQYLAATSITQTVAVGTRNQTLSFTTATNAITDKTYSDSAFVVEATSTESGATITYSLGTGTTNSACAVTSYGLVTIRNVGVCEIDVDSASTLAYAAASTIKKTIQVNADYANAPYIISKSAGNKSITVSFTEPTYNGGASITGYQVVAVDQTTGSSITISESGCSAILTNDVASCTVRGLSNGVTYKVKVAAINAAGVGEYSDLSNSLTAATNPAAVQGLQVAEDNTSLIVSWSDPDSLGGGTFSEYRIFIKRTDSSSYSANYFAVTSQTPRTFSTSTQWPSGTALQNGVSYDVKVVTVTTANSTELTGNTALANKVPRTVPDPPMLATTLIVDNKLVISWSVPVSDGGAAINSYSASFDGGSCTLTNPTDTFCVVPNPTDVGDYLYEVRAQNVAGLSEPAISMFSVLARPTPNISQTPSKASPSAEITTIDSEPKPESTVEIAYPLITASPSPTTEIEVLGAAPGNENQQSPDRLLLWVIFVSIIATSIIGYRKISLGK